jgi:hypothetical protein
MEITTERKPLGQGEADALIVPVLEGARETVSAWGIVRLRRSRRQAAGIHLADHAPGSAAKRLLLAGAGKAEKFDAAEMRKTCGGRGTVPEA